MELSTLAPGEEYDRRKAGDPKLCLVVAVDHSREAIQVARICATTVRSVNQVGNGQDGPQRATDMHPHKDISYSTNPIATATLQNYWVHRNNYIKWRKIHDSFEPGTSSAHQQRTPPHPSSMIYTTPPHSPVQLSPWHNQLFQPTHPRAKRRYPITLSIPSFSWTGTAADADAAGHVQHPVRAPRSSAHRLHRATPQLPGGGATPRQAGSGMRSVV
ncbi:hypothetical protein B0H10DRAFT_2237064 [Mycena sp. CBHHK59/15]|nr:hypothetical protein B0H10DRAFT_2237064 [Mycena sp. CBHHK59/15]